MWTAQCMQEASWDNVAMHAVIKMSPLWILTEQNITNSTVLLLYGRLHKLIIWYWFLLQCDVTWVSNNAQPVPVQGHGSPGVCRCTYVCTLMCTVFSPTTVGELVQGGGVCWEAIVLIWTFLVPCAIVCVECLCVFVCLCCVCVCVCVCMGGWVGGLLWCIYIHL